MNLMRQIYKAITKNLIIALIVLCVSLAGAALLCGNVLLCGITARAAEPAADEEVAAEPAADEEAAAEPAADDRIIPDPSQKGSLTVVFTNEAGEPDKFGNKVGLYKVADIKVDDGFSLVYDELFESVGKPPYRDAQLGPDLAQKINETAEIKGISLDAPSEEIWSDGQVTFKGTEAGLYLVVQTYRISDSEKSLITPFLVMIPERKADGTLNYDVKTSPEGSSNRKTGSESQIRMLSEITPDSKLPNVGAENIISPEVDLDKMEITPFNFKENKLRRLIELLGK